MPESPEVDALAGFLRSRVVHRRIAALELEEYGALKTRDRGVGQLADRSVTGVRRFGKHVALDTDGPALVVGFGRSGWMRWLPDTEAVTPAAGPDVSVPAASAAPVIARLSFDDDAELELTDAGSWLSVGLWIVDDPADVPSIAKLGPDPASADFTAADLDRILIGRRKQLKSLLQEQETLAGIGNAYSDEILYVAGLWPLTHASALDENQRAALYRAVREVLGDAFAQRRDVPIDQLKAHKAASMRVHGRTGQPCPDGAGIVADVPGSKGAAQYCPAQRPPDQRPPDQRPQGQRPQGLI